MNEPLDATLRRLEQERLEADRRYNEALTALDAALPALPELADPQLPLDEHQLQRLNEAWNILPDVPAGASGIRGRLAAFIWRTVGPYLQRQLTFNSTIVDHINRTVEAQKAAHRQELERAAALRAYRHGLGALHGTLMLYLQQITAYVDTKDRDMASGALVLNAAVNALAEAQGKYGESVAAWKHRHDTQLAAVVTAQQRGHEELRQMLGVAQHAIAALKRHAETGSVGVPRGPAGSGGAEASQAFAPSLDAYKYVGFENQFRGSEAVIRARQESYLPYFNDITGDVLDVGSGRGEFIELLQSNGIAARGIDLNHEMAALCRARGLDVVHGDAVEYLSSQPDEALGGIFAAQVVEHLEPSYLLRLLDLAFQKLRPGGVMVLETLNPACWTAFFESYIRDITHRWPLHPETLKYLVTASGFTRADIEFRSPVAPEDRLQALTVPTDADEALHDLARTFNGNMEKLNARMFTHLDYAIVARKGNRT